MEGGREEGREATSKGRGREDERERCQRELKGV